MQVHRVSARRELWPSRFSDFQNQIRENPRKSPNFNLCIRGNARISRPTGRFLLKNGHRLYPRQNQNPSNFELRIFPETEIGVANVRGSKKIMISTLKKKKKKRIMVVCGAAACLGRSRVGLFCQNSSTVRVRGVAADQLGPQIRWESFDIALLIAL